VVGVIRIDVEEGAEVSVVIFTEAFGGSDMFVSCGTGLEDMGTADCEAGVVESSPS
jgi:hypothetical protein